jgi:hypothetical protein
LAGAGVRRDPSGHRAAGLAHRRRRRAALIRQLTPDTPVVFYIGQADPHVYTPPGAFGIASDPEDLLHLILDVMERKRM